MTFIGTTDGPGGGPDRDDYEDYEDMLEEDQSYVKMKRITPREPIRREKKESRFRDDEIAYRDM